MHVVEVLPPPELVEKRRACAWYEPPVVAVVPRFRERWPESVHRLEQEVLQDRRQLK